MSPKHQRLLESPEFRALATEKTWVSIVLTLFVMGVYYGFIFLVAYEKAWLGSPLTERITVGIPIGVAVILLSWVGTGLYVWWANGRHDALVADLKKRLED